MAVLLQAVIALLWATVSVQAACPPPIDGRWNRGFEHRWVKNEGWSGVEGRCLATVRAFPNQCDDVCISNGGRWATVQSQAQNDWFLARGKELNENIWIGLTDHEIEGTYQWTNPGDSVNYTNWGPGEPANDDAKQCAFMWSIQDFKWRAASCIAGQVYCGCVTDDLLSPTRAQARSEIGFEGVSMTVGESALTTEQPCPAGWESRFGKCYLATPKKKNYPTCMAHCTSLNATLPCVTNARESMYLVGLYPGDLEFCAFIGLNDIVTEGVHKWHEGCDPNFTYFSPGEPNNYHDEDCVSVCLRGVTMWNDLPCSFETYCVCEGTSASLAVPVVVPEAAVPASIPVIAPACPGGWESKFGKCYLTTLPKQNYTTCLSTCTALEATLPCVMSAEESLYLVDLSNGRNDCAFLGLNDIVTEGKFVWQEGCDSTFTYFLPGEPNNHYDEDCVSVCMGGKTKWNDISCRFERNCVCEKNDGATAAVSLPPVASPPPPVSAPAEPPSPPVAVVAVPMTVSTTVYACHAHTKFGLCNPTNSEKENHDTCLATCANHDAVPPCVTNTKENKLLRNGDTSGTAKALGSIFLGLNDIAAEDARQCQEDCASTSTNHQPGGEQCVTVYEYNLQYGARKDGNIMVACVCEKKKEAAPLVEAAIAPDCPEGWKSKLGKCYLTTNPKMDYPTCLSHCADLEASLPCVMNTEENTYLSTLPSSRDPALWGTYLSRNLMVCSSWYSKYNSAEPYNCLTVSNDWSGNWYSIPCIVYATCVCEKKADFAPVEALTVPEPAVVPTTGSTTPQHQCTCADCAALYSASQPQAAHECSLYCYNNC